MTIEDRYRERYQSGDTPWDVGQPDFNLIEVVSQRPVLSCKVLDIGCGTGDNSIWLAGKGFQVIGTDTSDIAIEKARRKASEANAECHFVLVDFLNNKIDGAPFGFIFDRGCFHSFGSENDRNRFAENVAAHLEEAGLWLTLVGNADERRQGPGPPQQSAGDIVLAVEPYFEVLSLISSHFTSKRPNPPRAWRGSDAETKCAIGGLDIDHPCPYKMHSTGRVVISRPVSPGIRFHSSANESHEDSDPDAVLPRLATPAGEA